MLNQSFRQVFVTNTPLLLPAGSTVENIAVGQVGILDAKTYKAVTAPTYGINKALYLVHGTPDTSYLPPFFGPPNENEYSKIIKGRLLKDFKGKAAHKGQNEAWVLGFSGDPTDTNTLFARVGEVKGFDITLTGGPINKLFSSQGITRKFQVEIGAFDECVDGDPCALVDCRLIVEDLVKQVNSDPQISRLVKASPIIDCTPDLTGVTTDTDYVFKLTVLDTKDAIALANVQAQYPNDKVTKIGESGLNSIYQVVRDTNTLPAAFGTSTTYAIPDCDVCPAGYTLISNGFAYKVTRNDAGDATALTAVSTAYGIAGTEVNTRASYVSGTSVYILASTTAIGAAAAGDVLEYLGPIRHSCIITSPTTVAWVASGTLTKYARAYRITLADDVCSNDRLTALQAAYPGVTIAIVAGSTAACLHTYEATVFSQAVDPASCTPDQLVFQVPAPFEGTEWEVVPQAALPGGTTCKCGIRFDAVFVNRETNECSFEAFPFEYEAVHLHISTFNQNYNASPDESMWVAKKIQGALFPAGQGGYIQKLEKDSLLYALRTRSSDPVLRDLEQFQFQAQQGVYYDEYALHFDFEYKVGGWSEKYVDSYILYVYFRQGEGKAFENAINAYIASAGLPIDPVVL